MINTLGLPEANGVILEFILFTSSSGIFVSKALSMFQSTVCSPFDLLRFTDLLELDLESTKTGTTHAQISHKSSAILELHSVR